MGITTIQNKYNNPIVQKVVRGTTVSSIVDTALGLHRDALNLKAQASEHAHNLSNLMAGITPEMKEAAAISGDVLASQAGVGTVFDGYISSKIKPIIKTDRLTLSPVINDMSLFGKLSPDTAQAIELLVLKEVKTNTGKSPAQPSSDSINAMTSELLTGATYLPMPNTISFDTAFEWQSADLGILGSAVLETKSKIQDNTSIATIAAESTGRGLGNLPAELTNTASAAFGENINKAIQGVRGKVYNPRKAVLFEGIGHREFSIEWNLAAQSSAESIQIMAFIKQLHIEAAPELVDGDSFFKYPNIFSFAIKDITTNKTILNRGKVAIVSLSCNYTPDGVWACFISGQPVHVTLIVGFRELDLPTKNNNIRMLSGIK